MTCKTFTTRWRNTPPAAALAVATLSLLAACSAGGPSGPAVTEQRNVEAFHAVDLRGAADVAIEVGSSPSLTVTSDQATLDRLTSKVRNGTLIIAHERHGFRWGGRPIHLRITMPVLDALTISGAGNVTISGVTGAKLAIALRGGGNVIAAGMTEQLDASIDGAGNMDLLRLVARDAQVTINGAGNLSTQATSQLNAVVNGVGSIRYAGNPPQVQKKVNGVGSISAVPSSGG